MMLVTVTHWLHCFLSERELESSVWCKVFRNISLHLLQTMDNTTEHLVQLPEQVLQLTIKYYSTAMSVTLAGTKKIKCVVHMLL